MKIKYLRPGFISSLLAFLSLTSLALLRLPFLPSAIGRPAAKPDPFDLHAGLAGGTASMWTEFAHGVLFLTLVLTALFSLFSLLWSRRPETSK